MTRKHEAVSLPKWTMRDIVTSMSSFVRNTIRTVVVAMLVSGAAAAPAHAQDSTREIATPDSLASWYRDPQTAQILGSFIPGAGHFYAGEKLRGLGLSGAALIGIASGIVFLEKRECHLVAIGVESCNLDVSTTDRINGITNLAVGVAAWVFGAIDAPHAARRANERARQRVSVAPFARDDGVRHVALGVAVSVGW
jgi:hypothetical protein